MARKKYCKTAIEDQADLKAIREKPTPSMIAGLIMIGFSYIIGLPAVVAMGIIAVWAKKPLVAVIGGPLIYAISTIIFIIGIRMAGKTYVHVFADGWYGLCWRKFLAMMSGCFLNPVQVTKDVNLRRYNAD